MSFLLSQFLDQDNVTTEESQAWFRVTFYLSSVLDFLNYVCIHSNLTFLTLHYLLFSLTPFILLQNFLEIAKNYQYKYIKFYMLVTLMIKANSNLDA